ncbi:MAG: hypothetical protein RBU30_06940 [Polyangia bacterium]|nr:hypothetical protein [Polyangia bacterium]
MSEPRIDEEMKQRVVAAIASVEGPEPAQVEPVLEKLVAALAPEERWQAHLCIAEWMRTSIKVENDSRSLYEYREYFHRVEKQRSRLHDAFLKAEELAPAEEKERITKYAEECLQEVTKRLVEELRHGCSGRGPKVPMPPMPRALGGFGIDPGVYRQVMALIVSDPYRIPGSLGPMLTAIVAEMPLEDRWQRHLCIAEWIREYPMKNSISSWDDVGWAYGDAKGHGQALHDAFVSAWKDAPSDQMRNRIAHYAKRCLLQLGEHFGKEYRGFKLHSDKVGLGHRLRTELQQAAKQFGETLPADGSAPGADPSR